MNTRLLGFVLFLCAGLLHAQVVDLKKFWLSRRGPEEAAIKLKDGMYLKDQSGLLPPFIGTWAGVYRDYGYIVSINKHVFRGTYTKFTADLLYFTYEVYKKNEVGDWYIVEASYDSQGCPPFLRSAYYLEPQSYHTIYRGKNSDKRYGFVIFSLCPDESLRFYVMNDPTFDDIKEEEQVFPYWHKEAGITNFSHLYRVGEAGEMPVGRMQFYDKSLDALGFWQPMQRMLHSSRFLLEGKSYVPFLSAGFTNKLRYTTGDDLLDMDPFTSAPHPRLTPSGIRFRDQDWHTGEFSYELYYSSFFAASGKLRDELVHAHNFKQLIHAAMLEHLVQKFLTIEEKNRMLNDERELYGHDLIHVLQVYAKKRGISLNELKCHCLADAERLFTAQRLPHVSQIMQELKLLLERGY